MKDCDEEVRNNSFNSSFGGEVRVGEKDINCQKKCVKEIVDLFTEMFQKSRECIDKSLN